MPFFHIIKHLISIGIDKVFLVWYHKRKGQRQMFEILKTMIVRFFKKLILWLLFWVLIVYTFIYVAIPFFKWLEVANRYTIPKYSSELTEEEHFIEISNRAEEIVGKHLEQDDNSSPEYVVEMIYNFKDQPQFFAVKFSGGKGVLGAIIKDEYYILAVEKADRDIFWENVGNPQIKKYYNGRKYCIYNGEFLDANCRRRYDIKLSEEQIKELKTQRNKVFVESIKTKKYCKKLNQITKFEKPTEDVYFLYKMPEYYTKLNTEQHKQNILLRAQNKFNQLNLENEYLELKVELIGSFDYKLMYFLVTFVPKDGFEELIVYDFGIIVQDEYYFLNEITYRDNQIFFEKWNVENTPKYYVSTTDFNNNDKETPCFSNQGVFVVKREDKFYKIAHQGVVFLYPDNIPKNATYVMKVKNIYNPTVTDVFTIYQT